MWMASVSQSVPEIILSPGFLSTGIDSPVMELSFMLAWLDTSVPSTGTTSLALTNKMSPILILARGTLLMVPSITIWAVCGRRLMRADNSRLARTVGQLL